MSGGRAGRLAASVWLMFKRSLAHWKSLLPLVAGLVLASAIMAGTTIYYDALNNLAFGRALPSTPPWTSTSWLPIVNARLRTAYAAESPTPLSGRSSFACPWLIDGRIHAVKSETLAMSPPGAEASAGSDDRRAYFAAAPRLYDHVTLLPGGSRPRPPRMLGDGQPLEVEAVVPVDVADELGIEVGQILSAVPYGESAVPFARVTVSGLFERRDPLDDFWVLYERVLQKGASLTVDTLPLFVDEDAYYGVLGPAFGSLESTYGWLLDVDTERIDVADKERVAADIVQAQQWINSAVPGFRLCTSLLMVFASYDERLLFTKVPMLVFLVTAAMVVLYYVGTMASLIIERRRGDIVLLRARGAGSRPVLAVFPHRGCRYCGARDCSGPPCSRGRGEHVGPHSGTV